MAEDGPEEGELSDSFSMEQIPPIDWTLRVTPASPAPMSQLLSTLGSGANRLIKLLQSLCCVVFYLYRDKKVSLFCTTIACSGSFISVLMP